MREKLNIKNHNPKFKHFASNWVPLFQNQHNLFNFEEITRIPL